MTVDELAEYIKEHKNVRIPYPYGNEVVVCIHVRTVLYQHVHINSEHVMECCKKASNYEDFIEMCRPLAKSDTEAFLREKNKPPPKGRTKRRFR